MSLIIMFFKKRLSLSISVKKNRVIISNDIDKQLIKNTLYEFIDYFVICSECELPELNYFVNDNDNNYHNNHYYCTGCGHSGNFIENEYTNKIIKKLYKLSDKKNTI
jgi:translation initiation factor 2 beta subunit (eIF-2beta)/eIF-5